ncbi:TNF receptor-associated factor family protein DDB_G0285149-like [Dermacentor albipictus]|uniref:TNF receptor-associated factor family protein DDB_G0285149-like n=1 Tax=Dermacentor albipictus TaxID=60249 RepID=UPI0038FCFC8C
MLRKLECQHELCEHCYETITSYTCQLHGIRTRKKKVSEPRHNTDLDGVILACPRCAALKTYSAMTEHLLRKHNNLLMNSDCDDSTPLASTGEGDGDRQNDTVSRFEICPYSFKAWEKQEIKEHVFDCSEEITECPECLEHIKKGDYEEHVIQCRIKDEEKKAGGCARVKEEEDGKSEDKKRDDDIQELETKIQGQNINYKFRTVMCPLCEQEVSRKALAEHLNDTCEQRFLKCRYCSLDVEACHLQDHMDVCEEMPATCNHCKREFNTFAELRDEHLAVCPLKPMKCPYYRLGCNFQATNKEMEKHTASCKRVTSFVDRFLDLEEKLLDARAGYDELRRRTSETEKAFRELRLENEGLRKMISKNEEVNQIVQNRKMQNRTMQNDPMTEKRLRELEEKHALLETPLEKLLVEIAKTK